MGEPDETRFGVVVYESTSAACASERVLQRAGIDMRLVAVPRSLSTDCCLGVRFHWADREMVEGILREAGIPFVAIYPWSR